MTIERDFKLFKEQVPGLIRAQVESAFFGLRSQLHQQLEAISAPPVPQSDARIEPLLARVSALEALIERVDTLTSRLDALDRRLARYIEDDKFTLTRSMVIDILKAEFDPKGPPA